MKNANVSSNKILKVRRVAGVPVRSGVKAGRKAGGMHELGGPAGPMGPGGPKRQGGFGQ